MQGLQGVVLLKSAFSSFGLPGDKHQWCNRCGPYLTFGRSKYPMEIYPVEGNLDGLKKGKGEKQAGMC